VVRALTKHEQYMGTSQVTVRAVNQEEVEAALAPADGGKGGGGKGSGDNSAPPKGEEESHPSERDEAYPPRGIGRGRAFRRGRGVPPRMRGPPGVDAGDFLDGGEEMSVDAFGRPGCVLSVSNIPYRATAQDILFFFGDFNVTPEQILRRYDEQGRATSDARVAFINQAESQMALKTLNKQHMHDRMIYLKMV